MNFAFTEEQDQLREFVRSFLETKSSEEEVRRLMDTDDGYDPDRYERAQKFRREVDKQFSFGGARSEREDAAIPIAWDDRKEAGFTDPRMSDCAFPPGRRRVRAVSRPRPQRP